MRSSGERVKPERGNGLNGIRLYLQRTSRAIAASSRALRVAVVHAVEHHVLEGDEVARRLLEVAVARGEQRRAADSGD